MEIDWLKDILQVTDEYPSIVDFKKRVTDVAVDQINARPGENYETAIARLRAERVRA